jgi:hypothetical protein
MKRPVGLLAVGALPIFFSMAYGSIWDAPKNVYDATLGKGVDAYTDYKKQKEAEEKRKKDAAKIAADTNQRNIVRANIRRNAQDASVTAQKLAGYLRSEYIADAKKDSEAICIGDLITLKHVATSKAGQDRQLCYQGAMAVAYKNGIALRVLPKHDGKTVIFDKNGEPIKIKDAKLDIEIVDAWYGTDKEIKARDLGGMAVKDRIKKAIRNGVISVPANMNGFFGYDPVPGKPKKVWIQARINGTDVEITGNENTALNYAPLKVDYVVPYTPIRLMDDNRRLLHFFDDPGTDIHPFIGSNLTGQGRVVFSGSNSVSDIDSNWRIEDVEAGTILKKGVKIKLVHDQTNYVLRSHAIMYSKDFQEVTAYKYRSGNDWWEIVAVEKLSNKEKAEADAKERERLALAAEAEIEAKVKAANDAMNESLETAALEPSELGLTLDELYDGLVVSIKCIDKDADKKTSEAKYLRLGGKGTDQAVVSATAKDDDIPEAQFVVIRKDSTIGFKAANGFNLQCDSTGLVKAVNTNFGVDEQWTLEDGRFLKSSKNTGYLTVESDGDVTTIREVTVAVKKGTASTTEKTTVPAPKATQLVIEAVSMPPADIKSEVVGNLDVMTVGSRTIKEGAAEAARVEAWGITTAGVLVNYDPDSTSPEPWIVLADANIKDDKGVALKTPLKYVAASDKGNMAVISNDGEVYTYNFDTKVFTKLNKGSGNESLTLEMIAYGNTLWGVDSERKQVYQYTGEGWEMRSNNGIFVAAAMKTDGSGNEVVLMLNEKGNVYKHVSGSKWQEFGPKDESFDRIAVVNETEVYGIDDGEISKFVSKGGTDIGSWIELKTTDGKVAAGFEEIAANCAGTVFIAGMTSGVWLNAEKAFMVVKETPVVISKPGEKKKTGVKAEGKVVTGKKAGDKKIDKKALADAKKKSKNKAGKAKATKQKDAKAKGKSTTKKSSKPAAKKSKAEKKAEKAVPKKSATKKSAAKTKAPAKKSATKKTEKAASKKSAPKKSATKKSAAKTKAPAKKSASKKPAAKKQATKKTQKKEAAK